MSCWQRKPVADFDRTWEYRGGVFGYCLRCNGKAFTEAENEANRAARLEAVRLKRERHKSRRAALSPEDRAREDGERRIRKRAKTKESADREQRRLAAFDQLNRERAARGEALIDRDDVDL
jgi:hypothetical protein